MAESNIQDIVKEKYGLAALQVKDGRASCCGSAPSASGLSCDPITSNLYADHETSALPEKAVLASLGCGNPTALAKLEPGQVVLDLGSGGGIDVLLSARRVGPAGKAYGLDMTDEMLELARENQRKAGVPRPEAGREARRLRRRDEGRNPGADQEECRALDRLRRRSARRGGVCVKALGGRLHRDLRRADADLPRRRGAGVPDERRHRRRRDRVRYRREVPERVRPREQALKGARGTTRSPARIRSLRAR